MYQNPDKYQQVLQDVIRKVYEASSLFQQKLDQLKSELSYYSNLCKEEEKLNQEKSDELIFLENGIERSRKLKESYQVSIEHYQTVESKLKDVILQEAKLAVRNGNNPIIFSLKSMNGQTTLIENTRIKGRMIALKSKMMKKFDQLRELQKNVYCLDDSTENSNINFNDYQIFGDKNSEFLASQLIYKRNDAQQRISQYLLDNFQEQYQPHVQSPHNSITQISESMSSSIRQIEPQTEIPLYLANFRPQQFQKETDDRQFNAILSKVESIIEKVKASDEPIREKIHNYFNDINQLYQKRQEMLNGFYLSKQEEFPMKIIPCIDLLIKSSQSLNKTQFLIDTLNSFITTNASVPPSIWEKEHQIHFQMNKLLNSIDRITNFLLKTQKYVKIDQLGYQNINGQIQIDEISQMQIDQCKDLILELQDAFARLEKEKYSALEEIDNTITFVAKVKQDKKNEEENNEIIRNNQEKEFITASMSDLSLVEDEHLPEILQTRAALLEKQNTELTKLMDIIKTIPDELKEINFDQDDIKPEFKPLPTIHLPPVLSDEEADLTDFSQSSFHASSLTDEISETNAKYIEQIKVNNFGQSNASSNTISNLSLNGADSTSSTSQPILKVVKNDKLESILSSFQPKSTAFHDPNHYQALVEKKNKLIAYVNDLPRKLEHIKSLKSEIENMEKQIKNFPNYKERKLKEIENNQRQISELQEQIEIQKRSPEYQEYASLCEKSDSLQRDIDDLD